MNQSKSKKICCVVNCSSTYKNTTNIKFYSFPNKSYEKELKEKWIKAVNRIEWVFFYTNSLFQYLYYLNLMIIKNGF